ncbi:MAG TPA: FeS assembly SUF system protein [Saprospirales bacterium]|nr:FeS assembly SUF system protein [Saprospirales bacterium]HAY71338.1 FeS assembly SUF system protein [Saprospirales bacterium]HRQ29839.1 iron-sulfur cluster assembly protein [Saprospiraceae bacterium]
MSELSVDARAQLVEDIVFQLKTVYDPEIPIDIYELGLIYSVEVDESAIARIVMTLTTPNCPVAESLPMEVQQKAMMVKGINDVDLELTFTPSWKPEMASELAQLQLGLL